MKQKNPLDIIPKEILDRCVFKKPKGSDFADFPRLVEIINLQRDCDDCGIRETDRKVNIKHYKKPYPHWRKYCTQCQRWQNPQTGAWDMTNNSIDAYFRNNKTKPD